jgi:hypothetical protein
MPAKPGQLKHRASERAIHQPRAIPRQPWFNTPISTILLTAK